jgi:CHAT domain-containing protein
VDAISLYYRSRKLFDQKASESNFKKLAPDYGILHLAMHTLIDNQKPLYSKLVFSALDKGSQDDGLLNTYELFNLRLQGELAVLSACNTGTGRLERGEGIISLARGFFYAGIPSVVMTLWEIEDHSSADLMAYFYKNLKDGMPKDVALQQAKLSYLAKSDKLHSHPYFWAGFVNIGLPDPISASPPQQSWKWVLFTLPTLLLIIFGFLFLKRRVYFRKKGH